MTLPDRLEEASPEQVIGGTAAVTALLSMIDPLWQFVGATANTWFPAVAVFAGTVAPEIDAIPASLATNLLIAGGSLYVGIKLAKFGDMAWEAYRDG